MGFNTTRLPIPTTATVDILYGCVLDEAAIDPQYVAMESLSSSIFMAASCISFLVVLMWLISRVYAKKWKRTAQRLTLSMALSNLFVSVFDILRDAMEIFNGVSYVPVITALYRYFVCTSQLWITMIIFHVFLRLSHVLTPKSELLFEKIIQMLVWLLPIPVIYLTIYDSSNDKKGASTILAVVEIINLVFYFTAVLYFHRQKHLNPVLYNGIVSRISLFPIVCFICFAPVTIIQLLFISGVSCLAVRPFEPISIFANVIVCLWGAIIVLFYEVSSKACVRQCKNICGCCCRGRSSSSASSSRSGQTRTDKSGEAFRSLMLEDMDSIYAELTATYIDQLQIYHEIGRGGYGVVYYGIWKSRMQVAVKQIQCDEFFDYDTVASLEREIAMEAMLLKTLNHPNIVKFIGAGVFRKRLSIVQEYCSKGSLADNYKKKSKYLDWDRLLGVLIDAATGLSYLHSHDPPYLHRDIKSMNILIDEEYRGKLADFGTSRMLRVKEASRSSSTSVHRTTRETDIVLTVGVGTCQWMAPELLKGELKYGPEVDIYSFGMTMYELVARDVPFNNVKFFHEVADRVMAGERPDTKSLNKSTAIPRGLLPLMAECWHEDGSQRPTILTVISRLKQIHEELHKMTILFGSQTTLVLPQSTTVDDQGWNYTTSMSADDILSLSLTRDSKDLTASFSSLDGDILHL